MSSSVYLAFGGVAVLGIIGFAFAWITAPTKTPRPAQRTQSGTAPASRLTNA